MTTTRLGAPRRLRVGDAALAAGLFLALLALWEGFIIAFDVEEFLLPKPSVIFSTFVDELPVLWSAGRTTAYEALGGLLIGGGLGVVLALATARWEFIRAGALPFAVAANSTPIIALAPITIQWFGITDPVSKMAVVVVLVFFPVFINTVRGLTEVDSAQVELMRSYGASELDIVRRVRMPNALPYLFTALKVGATLSVIGAIVAEYFGGPRDTLGVYITQQTALFHFAEAWAAIVVGTLLGVAFYAAVVIAERVVMPWHASVRGGPE